MISNEHDGSRAYVMTTDAPLADKGHTQSSFEGNISTAVRDRLVDKANKKHQAFTAKLIPSLSSECILGVKMGELRTIARSLCASGAAGDYLASLPHRYLEEYQLHALVINGISNDVDQTARLIEQVAPYVNNWAVTDAFMPRCFKKHRNTAKPFLDGWLDQSNRWLQRIAIQILLRAYMDDVFDVATMCHVARCSLPDAPQPTDEFYLNMAVAWYLSMVLIHHPDEALSLFSPPSLPRFVHNTALQKARESRRVDAAYKAKLQDLKV